MGKFMCLGRTWVNLEEVRIVYGPTDNLHATLIMADGGGAVTVAPEDWPLVEKYLREHEWGDDE